MAVRSSNRGVPATKQPYSGKPPDLFLHFAERVPSTIGQTAPVSYLRLSTW